MGYTVTIDPGVHSAGIALWDTSDGVELHAAALVRTKGGWGDLANVVALWVEEQYVEVAEVIIEKPQIYAQHKLKGDPNDLITLAIAAGAIVMSVCTQHPDAVIHTIKPYQWKGQIPKGISVQRIQDQLMPLERESVCLPTAKSLQHNVWDAVGIGLYWFRQQRKDRS